MTAPRSYLLAALPCFVALLFQPRVTEAQLVLSPEVQSRIENVGACLTTPVVEKGDPQACQTLADRMVADHVPGVSVAVIHNGAIEWALGFGVVRLGGAPVTAETLFQAGSISKPVAAMAALHLVEQGRLSLDSDVNQALTSWKISPGAAAPGAVVTLRELLSHTAGLTVHGFPGYAATAPIPTLVQILNGEKPANTDPIRLEAPPGSRWKYSGGGYTVMQQLLIDVSHQPFPALLHDAVLAPIGMTHSTYEQPLPEALRAKSATPYKRNGTPVEGGIHTYPEMAAAGLWTTPTDLARFAIEIQRSLRGDADHVLSAAMTKQMLTVVQQHYGLGLAIGGSPENPYFTHDGVDAGFESSLIAYEQSDNGAVVMTNAQGGSELAGALIGSIAKVYDWPDLQPIVRTAIKLDPSILAACAGVYEIDSDPKFSLDIRSENGQLVVHSPSRPKYQLFPESQNEFFAKVISTEFEFLRDDSGRVARLVLHHGGEETRGERKQ
jgi:CubicO group peptidase (beta-lactamase class C family)